MKAEEIIIAFRSLDGKVLTANFREIVSDLGWDYGLSDTNKELVHCGTEVEILSVSIRGVEVRDEEEVHEADHEVTPDSDQEAHGPDC